MHILQVTPYYPPAYAYGGIPRIVNGLSHALTQLGHQVSVLTTDVYDQKSRVQSGFRKDQQVQVWTVSNWSNRLAFQQQLFLPRLQSPILDDIAKTSPIDIIHLHGHRHLLNNLVLHWAKKHQIPYVFTANGTLRRHEQKVQFKRIWDKLISGHIPFEANACIAVSDKDYQIHLDWGISSARLHTIPNGLDLTEFTNLPVKGEFKRTMKIPPQASLLVYLGRISPRKGVEHLVQAFQRLERPNLHLVIAGSDMGGLSPAKAIANQHPNIYFLDTIEGPQRLSLLQDADIVIYPSKNEIFGLVPFEALMTGTPTIVADDCGCGSLIRQSGGGRLISYGDVDGLVQEINNLLNDPDRCRDMVAKGQDYIQKHLDFNIVAQQHATLYTTLLS